MSPQGVRQVPKQAVSESEAAESAARRSPAAGAGGDVVLDGDGPAWRASRPTRRDTASPQNTASDVGTERRRPAQVPRAQQRDLIAEPRLQASRRPRRLVPRPHQGGDRPLEPGQVAVERRGDQRVERPALRVLQHADRVAAPGRLAAGLDVDGVVLAPRAVGPRRRPRSVVRIVEPAARRIEQERASRPRTARRASRWPGCSPSTGLVQSNAVSRRGMKLEWKYAMSPSADGEDGVVGRVGVQLHRAAERAVVPRLGARVRLDQGVAPDRTSVARSPTDARRRARTGDAPRVRAGCGTP